LEYIALDGPVTGTIPTELFLPKLKTLIIKNTMLTGEIPSGIGNLTSLTYLELSWNENIHGTIPKEILELKNLDSLMINNNALEQELDKGLVGLNEITHCDLSNNPTFTCPAEYGANICNVRCSGDTVDGMWLTESNTCKDSLLGAKWNR